MKQYFVTAILSKPQKLEFKLDDLSVSYYGVEVTMVADGEPMNTVVTFDKISKARKLQIGDVFER